MKKLLLLIAFGAAFGQVSAQQNIKEEVYMHLSSSDLIVGESLHFSAYTFSSKTGKLSVLSSLLYVELIDFKGAPVYQSKFAQEEGRASGSIFLPTSLETGVYRLVAYTRWMQNFGEFYVQDVTIVNPYKAYEDKMVLQSEEPKVDFYVEGGKLLAGAESRVIARVQSKEDDLKVRLLAKGGDKVMDLKVDAFGLIDFSFIPKKGSDYQLAMEFDEQFKFIDLPDICNSCTNLSVSYQKSGVQVILNSTEDLKKTVGRLEIWSSGQKLTELNTTLNVEHVLSAQDWPKGRLVAKLMINEELVNQRVFWNGSIGAISQIELPIYQTSEEVNWTTNLAEGSQVSVSVKKDYGQSLPEMILASRLMQPKLNIQDWTLINEKLVDRFMITNEWLETDARIDSVGLMPEYRFGIVQGKVISSDKDYDGVNVVLSFRTEDLETDAYQVDDQGRFILKYDPAFANQKGVVKVLNDEEGKYSIELNKEFYSKYPAVENRRIKFDSLRQVQLVERMVANQLQNAYYVIPEKSDSLRPYGKFGQMKTYVLDDFTRFPTMRDTFIELVIEVGVSKNVNKFRFNMRTRDIGLNDPFDPETMVLLDGAFSSAEDVLKLSPYLVERIEVLDRRYFIGDVMFDGVISVHTFDHDGGGTEPVGQLVDLSELQSSTGEIQTSTDKRAPKFNDLLYWNGLMETEDGTINLKFNTSHVPGKYRIQLEGIDPNGQAISKSYQFEVKQTLP